MTIGLKRASGKLLMIGTSAFLINTLFVVIGLSQNLNVRNAYEGYYLYINDYPDRGTTSWSNDVAYYDTYHCSENPRQPCHCPDNAVRCIDPAGCNQPTQATHQCVRDQVVGTGTQGIAHDADNWFITTQYLLWKIPVGVDLDRDLSGVPGVQRTDLLHVPAIVSAGYNHFGDLDHYQDGDRNYLVVPLQGGGGPPAIAVFQADNLSFIALTVLNDQDGAGWCAVAPNGHLFSSSNTTSKVLQYFVNWDMLRKTGQLSATLQDSFDLHVLSDDPQLHHMQGGEFTPSGELLYVSCGILKCDPLGLGGGEQWPSDGLHVFDTSTWQEVQRSFNSGFRFSCCPPHFIYRFSNDCEADEPEGLTIWDLDDGRAPNVRGQLHVLLFNHANPINPFSNDVVSLKHYTGKIHVDGSAPPPPPQNEYDPPPLLGTSEQPFNTVSNAFNWYNPIWDGAEIVIKAGSYPETGTFSKRVRLVSEGGVAILGQ